MANVLINKLEWGDAAILTASDEEANAPGTNLQDVQPTTVWQTTGLSTLFLELNLASADAWDTVAVMYSNASSSATWRIRAADSQANLTLAPSLDTSTMTFWASAGLGAWTRTHSFHKEALDITEPWLRIDIIDGTNPDGFFRAGRLAVGKSIQPSFNFQFPYVFGPLDNSVHRQTIGNNTVVRALPTRLHAELDIDFLPEAETYTGLFELDRLHGAQKPVLVVLDADDTTNLHAKLLYGLIAPGDTLRFPVFHRSTRRYSITEMI